MFSLHGYIHIHSKWQVAIRTTTCKLQDNIVLYVVYIISLTLIINPGILSETGYNNIIIVHWEMCKPAAYVALAIYI